MADAFPEPRRYSFDFADLAPVLELRVLPAALPLPAAAEAVSGSRRPSWLPRLLPLFAAGRPLAVGLAPAPAPTFAALLLESLAGLFATAGADSGLKVVRHPEGFVCGVAPLALVEPSTRLVPADLTAASIAAAGAPCRSPQALLVLNGRLPGLEKHLLHEPPPAVYRLPLIGRAELEAARRNLPAALGSRPFGQACHELAQELVRRHREQET